MYIDKLQMISVSIGSVIICCHIIGMLFFPLKYKKYEKNYRASLWSALIALYMTTAFLDMVLYYDSYLRDSLCYTCLLFIIWLSIKKYNKKILEYENNQEDKITVNLDSFNGRLLYIIYLMNEDICFKDKIDLNYIKNWIGLDLANEIEKDYVKKQEPTYKCEEEVAYKLGVNPSWMKGFNGVNPFQSILPRIDDAERLLEYENKGEYIFAIKDSDKDREILVMEKINGFRYEIFPKPFVFHSDVGATGRRSLYSLYVFLKEISNEQGKELNNIYFLPEGAFYELLEGECYPGIVNNYYVGSKYMLLSHFLNIKAESEVKEQYKMKYGEDFVKMQEIIEKEIERHQMIIK